MVDKNKKLKIDLEAKLKNILVVKEKNKKNSEEKIAEKEDGKQGDDGDNLDIEHKELFDKSSHANDISEIVKESDENKNSISLESSVSNVITKSDNENKNNDKLNFEYSGYKSTSKYEKDNSQYNLDKVEGSISTRDRFVDMGNMKKDVRDIWNIGSENGNGIMLGESRSAAGPDMKKYSDISDSYNPEAVSISYDNNFLDSFKKPNIDKLGRRI